MKSPNKSPYRQTDDLAPVKLEDPKMKPIPVNRSRRVKSSSCYCRAATMVIISVCTVGFLAAVAGLIYMEVFAKKNLASHESSVTPADLTEYKLDFPEGYDQLSSHELNTGKGREKVHNPIKKGTSDKASKDHTKETSISNGMDSTNKGTEKADNIELNQYLNKAKIKFQDRETVIYEVKTSDSMKFENSAFDGLRGRSFINFNATEERISNGKNVSEMIEEQKFDSVETIVDSQHGTVKEQPVIMHEKSTDNEIKNKGVNGDDSINDDSVKTESEESEQQDMSHTTVEHPESEILVSETAKDPESPMEADDDTPSVKNLNVENVHNFKFDDSFDNKLAVELRKQAVETVPFVEYADEDASEINNDHNIDSMLEVVDDPEEANTDYVFSKRNGDSFPAETSTSTEVNTNSVQPENIPSADLEISQPDLPKKPVDIKVSLAEAMKRLQVLDTNNKILTSRTKIGKPKENTKKRKQSNIPWNKDASLERMKYLQKVRHMLYEGFQ